MPIIQPDTSQAQDMGPIEPGTYPARILEVNFQTSKKNNPMIVPKFEIMVEGKRRIRQAYLVITGEGAYGFDQLLRACGFVAEADQYKDPNSDNPPFDTDQLVNQELNVIVDNEIYNDQKRDAIKAYQKA